MELRCENCGDMITYNGRGRPPTRFCSRACKDARRGADDHARKVAVRGGLNRRCLHCDNVISAEMNMRTKYCSLKCGITASNIRRQAAKRAVWLATNPVCQRQQCGKPIPESRPRWSKYCSPECKKKEMDARWRAKSPHYNRQYNYGMSVEQFDALLAAQDNRCAICGTTEWPGKGPHVDHDHGSGAVRGILCGNCNNGLGMFGEDPARLRAAAEYLEKAREE